MDDRDIQTNELVKVFSDIRDEQTMSEFFDEIFTPAERRDLSLRWESMKLLMEKIPQRKISKQLGISLCKITRGAKVLKKPDSVSKNILEKQATPPVQTPEL